MFWKKEDKPYIKFRHREDFEFIDKPKPAIKYMPKWLQKVPRQLPDAPISRNGTIKRCIPVIDACSQGYIIPAWCDFNIKVFEQEDEETGEKHPAIFVETPSKMGMPNSIEGHAWEQVGDDCPLKNYPVGRVIMKLTNPWVIETSPGWSILIKPPANAFGGFRFIEGVVDTDTYRRQINFPFFWDGCEQGEFNIMKGDPLIQIIPFKRQEVEMQIDKWDEAYMQKMDAIHDTTFHDRYRKQWWHKRTDDCSRAPTSRSNP